MSWLSDAWRGMTGGMGIGETIGGGVGGIFGGPTGAEWGRRVGGAASEGLSNLSDWSEGQQTARDISPGLPRETGMSGQYGYGSPLQPGIPVTQGRMVTLPRFGSPARLPTMPRLPSMGPGTGVGVGAVGVGIVDWIYDMFGNPKKLVITRKMQREVKQLFTYMGGDLNMVAHAYSQYRQQQFNAAQIQRILLKRFRNDGAYITKAAIRKTRQTVRKLDRLEQLKKQITGTRRAPARRRASTTRITNVK